MDRKPITAWLRFDEKSGRWNHNHIEDGHVPGDGYAKPTGNPEQTRNWAKGTWMHEHKHLENGKVV